MIITAKKDSEGNKTNHIDIAISPYSSYFVFKS